MQISLGMVIYKLFNPWLAHKPGEVPKQNCLPGFIWQFPRISRLYHLGVDLDGLGYSEDCTCRT